MRRALLIALAALLVASGTAEAKHRHHHKLIVPRMTEQEARAAVEGQAHLECAANAQCRTSGAVLVGGALSCNGVWDFTWACFGWTRLQDEHGPYICQFRVYAERWRYRQVATIWDDTYGWHCEREEDQA